MRDYSYPEIRKYHTTVKLYVNGKFLVSQSFMDRHERHKWMNEKIDQLVGCCGMYFIIYHHEFMRTIPKKIYMQERRKKLKDENALV